MNRTIPWFLINAPQPLDLGAEAANYTPGVEELTASLDKVVCEEDRVQLGEQAGRWESQGVPADLAHRVASLGILASALDITRIARLCRRDVPDVARSISNSATVSAWNGCAPGRRRSRPRTTGRSRRSARSSTISTACKAT